MTPPRPHTLVAGIGNLYLGDDGFGVEVVRRLEKAGVPAGVKVRDFGIRGYDLAYELTEPYERAILVDAVSRQAAPGTLFLLEPTLPSEADARPEPSNGHGVDPFQVLLLAGSMGTLPKQLRVLGCEPAFIPGEDELLEGLSPPVLRAVDEAVAMIQAALLEVPPHA